MEEYNIRRIDQLDASVLQPLLQEGLAEGYRFLARLHTDYLDGTNRFDQVGEALFGVYVEEELVGIVGLNRDEYVSGSCTGRVRRLYIANDHRGKGVGRKLLAAIISHASMNFSQLTLRTGTEEASRFYDHCGFARTLELPESTHILTL